MIKKTYQAPIELKADGKEGSFTAVFSRFDVIDHDGDVTRRGAFEDGQRVRIAYWGHRWQDLPVGKGVIHADEEKAWVDGEFFLDTQVGRDTYQTVKNLEDLQEWSYGFDVVKSSFGKQGDQDVRFLETLVVHEVSPVMLGAGIGTGTVAIKSADADAAGALDDAENDGEGQTGDGVPSGASPQVMLTQINIMEWEN